MDEDSGSETFEVERIIGLRRRGRSVQFHVRWKGYGSEENSWEPVNNLSGCPELVEEFVRLNPQHRSLLSGSESKATGKRKRGRDVEAAKSPQATAEQSPDAKRKRRTQTLEAESSTTGTKQALLKSSPRSPRTSVTGEEAAKPRRSDKDGEKLVAAAVAVTSSGAAATAVEGPSKGTMPTPLQSPRPTGNDMTSFCKPEAHTAVTGSDKTPEITPTSDVPVVAEPDARASQSCQSAAVPGTIPTEVTEKKPTTQGSSSSNAMPGEAKVSPSTEEQANGLVIASSRGSTSESLSVAPAVQNGKSMTTPPAVEPPNSSACDGKESYSPPAAQHQTDDRPMDIEGNKETTTVYNGNAPAKVQSDTARKDPSPVPVVKPTVPVPAVKPTTPVPAVKPTTPVPVGKPTTPVPAVKPTTPVPAVKPTTPVHAVKPTSATSTARPAAEKPKDATEGIARQSIAVKTDLITHTLSNGAAATPVKSACGLTPQSNKALARTPGVAGVFESASATPLWKAPTSNGEKTCALLTVDAVQQQGSLRQPHAPGHDPFTENWVKSLEGVQLLGHEDTVNQQNIEHQEQAMEKKVATVAVNGTNSNGKLPSPAAVPVNVEQKENDPVASSHSSNSSLEQELDLPFGTNIQSEAHEENGDFDFDDYQESEAVVPEKSNCTAAMDATPDNLASAAMEGNISVFRRAIHQNVDLNRIIDGKGVSLLAAAIQYGQDEIVQLLLDTDCTTVHTPLHNGDTPLMIAAQRNRHAICTRLVRAGAQLDAQSPHSKETALIMACKRDHLLTVEALLRPASDLSVRDNQGLTALEYVQAMHSTLELRMQKHIKRMTEFFMNAVTQRVQLEGTLEQPPLLGFRSFSASNSTPYRIAFDFQKTASSVNIRLFLMRGRVKKDTGGLRLTWARCGTVSSIHLNGEEVKPQVRHSMYQLWPRIGKNEIAIQLAPPSSSSDQQQTGQMDRIFACLYNVKKHA